MRLQNATNVTSLGMDWALNYEIALKRMHELCIFYAYSINSGQCINMIQCGSLFSMSQISFINTAHLFAIRLN